MQEVDLGKVVGEVNQDTVIEYTVPDTYTPPSSGDSIRTIFGKITKGLSNLFNNIFNRKSVADEYWGTGSVGDYCINNNTLYKCIENIIDYEEFDPSKWEAVKIAEEFIPRSRIANNLATTEEGFALDARMGKQLNNSLTSNTVYPYNSSTSYSSKDIKMEGGSVDIEGTQGTVVSKTINFKNSYSHVPLVMISPWSTGPDSNAHIGSTNPSTTQVTIYSKNDGGTLTRVNYLVIGI